MKLKETSCVFGVVMVYLALCQGTAGAAAGIKLGSSAGLLCQINFCQNGGICYRIQQTPLKKEACLDGFDLLDQTCVGVFTEDKSWLKASDRCSQTGGALLSIPDQKALTSLQEFIAQQQPPVKQNLWTSGVTNGSSDGLFLWGKSNAVVNSTLLGFRQVPEQLHQLAARDASGNSAAIIMPIQQTSCLALDAAASFKSAVILPCETTLPFICQMNVASISDDGSNGDLSYQCQCKQGFEGSNCETNLDVGVESYGTGLKCADDTLNLSCPTEFREQRIEIEYSMYGEILNKYNVCTSHSRGEMAVFNPACSSANALVWLKENCHGKNNCSVKLSTSSLSAICPKTGKQLQYRYRCVDQSENCPAGQFFVEDSCYEIFNQFKATWTKADTFCHTHGGELPSVPTLDAEIIIKEALRLQITKNLPRAGFNGEQNSQIWLGYHQTSSDVFDHPGSAAGVLASSLPMSIKKSLSASRNRGRTRQTRDDNSAVDQCLSLAMKRTIRVQDTTTSWKLENCGRQLGWICKFPIAVAEVASNATASVHSRSVNETQIQSMKGLVFSTVLPRTVVPPLNLSFPRLTNLPPIADMTYIQNPFVFSTMTPLVVNEIKPFVFSTMAPMRVAFSTAHLWPVTVRPFCAQTSVNGKLWQESSPGTFVVHNCENGNWTKELPNKIVESVRKVVHDVAAEQVNLYDINIAKFPFGDEAYWFYPNPKLGFSFWMCVETMSGPRYLPSESPIGILCDRAKELDAETSTTTTKKPSPVLTLAEAFANKTASGGLSGREILSSVNLLQLIINKQSSQSKARIFDPEPISNTATEQFAGVVTRSISNMLKDVHRPGWIELNSDERSSAATGLLKAAEESAAMVASVSPEQTTRMQYENIVIQVTVLPDQDITQDVVFTAMPGVDVPGNQSSAESETDVLKLPAGMFRDGSFKDSGGNVRLSFMHYGEALSVLLSPFNISADLSEISGKNIVNSRILSASVFDQGRPQSSSVDLANETVTLIFRHTFLNGESPKCVFWNMYNTSNPFWDSTGCSRFDTNQTHTTCKCSHLTSFAVLMDLTGALDNISSGNKLALTIISYIGCVISIICLGFCLIIFTFFRSLWCDRVTIHRNLCFCLLIAQFVFVLGADRVKNQIGCAITAGMLHYTLLAAFAWMLLEGLELYMMLVKVFESEESRRVWYYAFGYGFPGIIVAVAAGIRPDHYGTPNYCWLRPEDGFVWSFVGPVLVIVCVNMVFLGVALASVFRVRNPKQQNGLEKVRGWLRGSIMLLCLLGTTWLFGLLYVNYASTLVFAYLFTICNSLQGMFIFIFHCIMNEKVLTTVRRYVRRCSWCPQWCKDVIGASEPSKSSGKDSSSHSRHGSILWNFVKPRRASHDSSMSSQLAITKKGSNDSDYWSKTSSYKSQKGHGLQRANPRLENQSSESIPNGIKQEMTFRKFNMAPAVSPGVENHSGIGYSNPAFSQDNVSTNDSRL